MKRIRVPFQFLVASLLMAGCSDVAGLLSPAGVDLRPAKIALTASVAASVTRNAADVVSMRVASFYLVAGETRVPISTQTLVLTSAATQAVPVAIDLATCLGDNTRVGQTGTPGCSVVFDVYLIVNGIEVDKQTIGPLRLAPGVTATVNQPVALFEIASIELTPTERVSLTIGATATVTSVVRDSRGIAVTERTVSWRSESPTVATVNDNGLVTAIGVGEARIVATLGSLASAITVAVIKPPVALTITPPTIGSGTGVIQSQPAGINCRIIGNGATGTCTSNFAADAQVVLTSTAEAGQMFGGWNGACAGNAIGTQCTLTMAQARVASAQFIALRRVTIQAGSAGGSGRVTGSFGIDCRIVGPSVTGTCAADVAEGASVTLNSTPDAANGAVVANVFAGWGGNCAGTNGASCTFVLGATGANAIAGFHAGKSLSIGLSGAGGGSVTLGASGACNRSGGATSGLCQLSVVHGGTVTLTAAADAQSEFSGWSDACTGQNSTCVVSMTEARAVSAAFAPRNVVLTLSLGGSGSGSVSVNGAAACSRTTGQASPIFCAKDYLIGTVLTLTASAGAQSDFQSWGGACAGNAVGANCTVTMSQAREVSANFNAGRRVSVTGAAGDGKGRVTGSFGIDCRIDGGSASGSCTADVTDGAIVVLTSTPDGASGASLAQSFTGWGGDCAGAGTAVTCQLTVSGGNRQASAGFQGGRQLSVSMLGTGGGSVSSAVGIACSRNAGTNAGACNATVRFGEVVRLSVLANAQSDFSGWGGACAGESADCFVTMNQAVSVSASFIGRGQLTIGSLGSGSGIVRSTEATPLIDCVITNGLPSGPRCVAAVTSGSLITLRSVGNTGNALTSWGGACAGRPSYECGVVVGTSTTVNANFSSAIDLNMTLNGQGTGSVTFDLGGAPSQAPCVKSSAGSSVTCLFALPTSQSGVFRGLPGGGARFDGFAGPCIEATSPALVPICTFAGGGISRTFTASFSPM